MSDSKKDSTIGTSSDDEVNLGDILSYDKEPEYREDKLAAGISDTRVDREESATLLETKGHWPPESRVGYTNWCDCGACSQMANRLDCFRCHEVEVISEQVRALREDGGHLFCKTQWEDFKVVCECLHRAILTRALCGYSLPGLFCNLWYLSVCFRN